MTHEEYLKRANKVGWRAAYHEFWLEQRKGQPLRDVAAACARKAAEALATAILGGGAVDVKKTLERALVGELQACEKDNMEAHWEGRYRTCLKRASQLLKRATDAERVVDALRASVHDMAEANKAKFLFTHEMYDALRAYDAGKHR